MFTIIACVYSFCGCCMHACTIPCGHYIILLLCMYFKKIVCYNYIFDFQVIWPMLFIIHLHISVQEKHMQTKLYSDFEIEFDQISIAMHIHVHIYVHV